MPAKKRTAKKRVVKKVIRRQPVKTPKPKEPMFSSLSWAVMIIGVAFLAIWLYAAR